MSSDPKHILIIDNDVSLREALYVLLKEEQFRVNGGDIKQFGEKLYKCYTDLAIVDIPFKEDGQRIKKLVKKLKEHNKEGIGILVTSADKRVRDITRMVGGHAFLEEPFDIETFLKKIKQVFLQV